METSMEAREPNHSRPNESVAPTPPAAAAPRVIVTVFYSEKNPQTPAATGTVLLFPVAVPQPPITMPEPPTPAIDSSATAREALIVAPDDSATKLDAPTTAPDAPATKNSTAKADEKTRQSWQLRGMTICNKKHSI